MTNDANEILQTLCEGRPELLALGHRFNEEVEKSGQAAEDMTDLNNTVAAIFELEDIPFTDKESQMIDAMDKLNWGDEQAIEFLKAFGGV